MTESTPVVTVQPLSLVSRIIGVITAPKATFQNVVAAPRPFGVLLFVALVIGLGSAIPQFTDAAREAFVASQASRPGATPESAAVFEKVSHYLPYMTIGSSLIMLPIVSLFLTALYWVAFNTIMGGTATFKQVLAIVTHSQVVAAVGVLAALPIMLIRPTVSMGGPFNLGAIVPNLEEGSRMAAFLGGISVFSLWGVFVTALGLAVLYRRKTAPIFIGLLVVSAAVTYGFAVLQTLGK